jgi:hypothetical protein
MQSQIQVIRCPHCKEYIDARAAHCRFCQGYIDTLTTQVSAELQERVNAAYNEASWLRNVAGAYVIFAVIRFIAPFFAFGSSLVLPIMFVALPVMLVRWRLRFGRLQTDDPDYPRAQRNWNVTLLIWLLVPVAYLALILLRMPM